jgi:hypothetical protein
MLMYIIVLLGDPCTRFFNDCFEQALWFAGHVETTATLGSPSEVGVASAEDGGEELYGCFSPRVGDYSSLFTLSCVPSTAEGKAIAAVVAPMVQIMPRLQELCTSPVLPLLVEHKKVDSPMTLSSPKQSDDVSTPVPPSVPDNPDALFAKELYDILSSLEAAIPGCGRAIACLLDNNRWQQQGGCLPSDRQQEGEVFQAQGNIVRGLMEDHCVLGSSSWFVSCCPLPVVEVLSSKAPLLCASVRV